MPYSVQYIMALDYKQNVALLLDLNNIYIVAIDNLGRSYIVDYINEVEAGGAVCWG